MIAPPQLSPTLSWKNCEDRVGDVDQRLQDVGDERRHQRSAPRRGSRPDRPGRDPQREAFGHGVEAPWLNGLQRSRRQPASSTPRRTPKRLIAWPRRRSRSARSGSGGASPARSSAGRRGSAPEQSRFTWNAPRGASRSASSMQRRAPSAPSRSISSPISGRATRTKSCSAGSRSTRPQNASRRARLTRLRSTAPPTLRLTETPRRISARLALAAGEAVEHQIAGRVGGPLAVDAVEVAAAREAPSLARPASPAAIVRR